MLLGGLGVVIGIPIGVAFGRCWLARFAGNLGVPPVPVVPVAALAGVAPIAVFSTAVASWLLRGVRPCANRPTRRSPINTGASHVAHRDSVENDAPSSCRAIRDVPTQLVEIPSDGVDILLAGRPSTAGLFEVIKCRRVGLLGPIDVT